MYVNVNAVNIAEKEQLFIELWKLLIINPFSASCIFKFSQPEPILFIKQI